MTIVRDTGLDVHVCQVKHSTSEWESNTNRTHVYFTHILIPAVNYMYQKLCVCIFNTAHPCTLSLIPRPLYITAQRIHRLHHHYAHTLDLVHRLKSVVPVAQHFGGPIRMQVWCDITNIVFLVTNCSIMSSEIESTAFQRRSSASTGSHLAKGTHHSLPTGVGLSSLLSIPHVLP